MKRRIATLAVGLSLLTSAHADEFQKKANKIGALYKSGLIAANQGKQEEARKAFQEVLRLQPGHGPARHQLSRLSTTIKQVQERKRVAHFKTTRLAEVDIKDATLQEALEALNYLSGKATENKFSPNFVIQDPNSKLSKQKISLNMRNVPLAAALKYVLEQAGARARYDQHATVIRPL